MKVLRTLVISLILGSVITPVLAKNQFAPSQVEQFYSTNQCNGCDLSNIILNDGPGYPQEHSNHSGAMLNNANLSNVHAYIVNFSAASMQNTNLSGADLEGANFSEADLTGAHFDGANVSYANFYGAKGVDIKNARDACNVTLPNGTRTSDCNHN